MGINHVSLDNFNTIVLEFKNLLNHSITFDDGFESVYKNAFPIMESNNLAGKVFPVIGYINKYNKWDFNFGLNKSKHLNKNQIIELNNHGWEIGSHSYFHHPYTDMTSKEIIKDLLYSKKYLEDLLSKEVKSFSVPFNIYSPKIFDLILDSGYKVIYFNTFYNSIFVPHIEHLVQRKPVFKITTLKSIHSYFKHGKNPFSDKMIQFCANATIGLKHLLY